MSLQKTFDKHFSEDNLDRIYQETVVLSPAAGIDNLSHKAFWPSKNEQIRIITKKVAAGTYGFTKYRLKLISKGRGKVPREISIPTIRDRIALRALCDFLGERYKGHIRFELPQNMVRNVIKEMHSGRYDGFIKLDVSNFYPTIKHHELFRRLRRKIRNPEIVSFIEKAITTPTVSKSSEMIAHPDKGVPQGLSISNVLAAIYLINIDSALEGLSEIVYYRYVDDIFILCDRNKSTDIAQNIIKRFRRLGLIIHDPRKAPEKSVIGKIGERFSYLGYQFEGSVVRPRDASLEKLKESLVSIFSSYKYSKLKNTKFLLWRLNLRITGCVFQNKSKGWMFFFSEINDKTILYNLDRYVARLCERFGVSVTPKRFVRAYHEIRHAKYETTYIPNFDLFTLDQKREVLIEYFGKDVKSLTDEEIDYEFRKRIDKQVKDLLTDVQDFGY